MSSTRRSVLGSEAINAVDLLDSGTYSGGCGRNSVRPLRHNLGERARPAGNRKRDRVHLLQLAGQIDALDLIVGENWHRLILLPIGPRASSSVAVPARGVAPRSYRQ